MRAVHSVWRGVLPVLVFILVASPAWSQVQLPIATTFDTGAEGWTLASGELGTVDGVSSGGDPGGYVRFTDAAGASSGHIVAPARYAGDWSALDGAASLSWQHQIINPGGAPMIGELVAFISGPGGTARHDSGALGQVGAWVSVSAPIAAGAWVIESGSWAAILVDVTEVRIRIEVVSNNAAGTEIAGIDNVVLDDGAAQSVAVPQIEPFDASLEGWDLASGEIGSVDHAPTGGNPDGHARFVDGVGPTGGHLVAPASWRGSWLGAGAPGVIAWDHKIEDEGGIPTISTLQAEITGPGGTARFDSGELGSTSGWIHASAPVEEAEWTVTAGSWDDILAHVTDVRIQIEGVSNGGTGDTSLLDNIELRASPPVPVAGGLGLLSLGAVLGLVGGIAARRR